MKDGVGPTVSLSLLLLFCPFSVSTSLADEAHKKQFVSPPPPLFGCPHPQFLCCTLLVTTEKMFFSDDAPGTLLGAIDRQTAKKEGDRNVFNFFYTAM